MGPPTRTRLMADAGDSNVVLAEGEKAEGEAETEVLKVKLGLSRGCEVGEDGDVGHCACQVNGLG